jgi:hypothetical protein
MAAMCRLIRGEREISWKVMQWFRHRIQIQTKKVVTEWKEGGDRLCLIV